MKTLYLFPNLLLYELLSTYYIYAFWKVGGAVAKECSAEAVDALSAFGIGGDVVDAVSREVLAKVDDLVSWANDIKEYALQAAISGKAWNGWKVVEGRSNRKYTDERLVAAAVIAAGHDPYEQKLLGITEMQKTLGKAKFDEILGRFITKPQGKPTLVPMSDKRPAMNTAASDFEN